MKYLNKRINSIYKSHGGKTYQARDIISKMDYRPNYVEPFFGGGSVFFNIDEKFQSVILNDINYKIISIFNDIKDRPGEFEQKLMEISVCDKISAKLLFDKYLLDNDSLSTLFINRFSRSANNKNFGWSDRLRGGRPEYINAWKNIIRSIPNFSKCLQGVNISSYDFIHSENKNILDNSIIYCDPPYVHNARISKKVYKFEMTNQDHMFLISILKDLSKNNNCISYLSGYMSDLYLDLLGKPFYTYTATCYSSPLKKKPKRQECLWEIKD